MISKKIKQILTLLLSLLCQILLAQEKKGKELHFSDYAKWQKIGTLGLCEDGKWTGYSVMYGEYQTDTLFVKNIPGNKVYTFPKATHGSFLSATHFACIRDQQLTLTELSSGKLIHIPDVTSYRSLGKGRLILTELKKGDEVDLTLLDLTGKILWQISQVTEYKLDQNGNLAYASKKSGKSSVYMRRAGSKPEEAQQIVTGASSYRNLHWQRGGHSLAFGSSSQDSLGNAKTGALYLYRLKDKKLFTLDSKTVKGLPEGYDISGLYGFNFQVANHGSRVYFTYDKIKRQPTQPSSDVQVWNTLDHRLYVSEAASSSDNEMRLSQWIPETGQIQTLGYNHQNTMTTGNTRFVITFDDSKYNASTQFTPEHDLYLIDLHTGDRTLFLEKHFGMQSTLFMSPEGKFISYFREDDWWIYSFAAKKHIRASRKENQSLIPRDFDRPIAAEPIEEVIWTPGDQSMIYVDQYDIWEYHPATDKRTRLTHGKETQTEYRFTQTDPELGFFFRKPAVLDLSKDHIVRAQNLDYSRSGYFLMSNRKIDTIVFSDKKITNLRSSKNSGVYLYVQQDFNSPPQIMCKPKAGGPAMVIYSSNPQHQEYNWGRSQRITYTDKSGKEIYGSLFYPINYDPTKKYPMIVSVYEKQLKFLHDYVVPTLNNETGLNISVMTSQGYFVLLPDIHYQTGKAGASATDCTLAATEKAIQTASIDRSRIGLIGISFGGFESMFIVTQTDLFAAAVAGAGMSDFISGALSVNVNTFTDDLWRYEYDQPRMGSSVYENWEGYLENSAIKHAAKIKTPLLLWSGTEDGQVNPHQSMELYMALRSQKKESTLLYYQGEGHGLSKPSNQADLSLKILQWFDHHLKGSAKPTWTKAKTTY